MTVNQIAHHNLKQAKLNAPDLEKRHHTHSKTDFYSFISVWKHIATPYTIPYYLQYDDILVIHMVKA